MAGALAARVLQISCENGFLPDEAAVSDPEGATNGWQIEHVDDLDEAVVRLASENFDLVVLNLGSIQADDLASVHRLRAGAPGVPILALTTDPAEATSIAVLNVVDDCILIGAGDVLFWRAARLAVEWRRYRDATDERREFEAHQPEMVGPEAIRGPAALTLAARSFGVGPSGERMPRELADIVACYAHLLDDVLEQRSRDATGDLADPLRDGGMQYADALAKKDSK